LAISGLGGGREEIPAKRASQVVKMRAAPDFFLLSAYYLRGRKNSFIWVGEKSVTCNPRFNSNVSAPARRFALFQMLPRTLASKQLEAGARFKKARSEAFIRPKSWGSSVDRPGMSD
jgi:hypothetical protein